MEGEGTLGGATTFSIGTLRIVALSITTLSITMAEMPHSA